MDFAPKTPAETATVSMKSKTATGEKIPADQVKRIVATDQRGRRRRMQGRVAPVHKPLAAASAVCDADADIYLGSDGGYIVGKSIKDKLRKAFDAIVAKEGYQDLVPVYRENGVYNFYVQVATMADAPMEVAAQTPAVGGLRQASRP